MRIKRTLVHQVKITAGPFEEINVDSKNTSNTDFGIFCVFNHLQIFEVPKVPVFKK